MAYNYLFFRPRTLPLTAADVTADTVETLTDWESARVALERVFPHLVWPKGSWGRGETEDGRWFEFSIAPGGTLSMRCSLRADYGVEVQRICDTLGWVAVDERPVLFQPDATPFKV